MWLRRCVVALIVLAPCAAGAQDSTADGIQALAAGDYARASRILRARAEDSSRPDPIAQFFLATLYQFGNGVPSDHIRACGLYMKAASASTPLRQRANDLTAVTSGNHPLALDLCRKASEGVWREPSPASFTLGPDHWVRIDTAGLTVGYQGTEKKAPMGWGGPDWVFLPVWLSTVNTPDPDAPQRHFLEFFVWIPYGTSAKGAWTLAWFVHEVVGADTLPAPGDGQVATAIGPQPPASFPVQDVARIVVNADGQVERVVLGADARTIVIPPQEAR